MAQEGLKELLGLPEDADQNDIQTTLLAIEQLNAQRSVLYIDGDPVGWDDLTFREKKQVRQIVRDELLDEGDARDEDGNLEWERVPLDAIDPAVVYVVKKRTDDDYTLEQALDVKRSELQPPAKKNGSSKRPTKGRTSKRA